MSAVTSDLCLPRLLKKAGELVSAQNKVFVSMASRALLFNDGARTAVGALKAELPPCPAELPVLVSAEWQAQGDYKSQFGQDQYIEGQVNKTGARFYLDLGCNDGISASNTFYFARGLGWQGVCVEADPDTFGRIAAASGRTDGVNVAVSDRDGPIEFTRALGDTGGGHSGISKSLDHEKIKRMGGGESTITVDGISVKNLLAKYYPERRVIDYVSMDIEGAELTVLGAWPWTEWCVNTWSIEDNDCEDMVRWPAARHRRRLRGLASVSHRLLCTACSQAELNAILLPQGYELRGRIGVDSAYVRSSACEE